MINTNILTKMATSDQLLNCWLHIEPKDEIFCRTCINAPVCREIAIKTLMKKLNLDEENLL